MKTPTSKLGKNIKRIREKKNMTQGDICRAVGLDRAQMSNIEAGKGNPTLATIEKMRQGELPPRAGGAGLGCGGAKMSGSAAHTDNFKFFFGGIQIRACEARTIALSKNKGPRLRQDP